MPSDWQLQHSHPQWTKMETNLGEFDKQYAGANDSILTSPGKRRTTFLLISAN